MFHVYILQCNDGSYYTGSSDNLEIRIAQHHNQYFPNCYTATRLPLLLVHQQYFYSREEALTIERQIKGWGRKKKLALINNDWAEISKLARCFDKKSQ